MTRAERMARAKALREAGASAAEAARAAGVSISTLYRWAEAGGWRGRDLEEAAVKEAFSLSEDSCLSSLPSGRSGGPSGPAAGRPCEPDGLGEPGMDTDEAASGPNSPDPEGPQARPRARSVSEDRLSGAKEDRKKPARDHRADTPDDPLSAHDLSAEASRCARAAVALSRGGRMKEAEAALKLAERYRALAGEAGGGDGGVASGPLAGLSANEAMLLTRARLRHAPHVLAAIRLVVRCDERRARQGRRLLIEADYGYGPFATPEQAAAFRAAAARGTAPVPAPLPIWDLPDPD